MSQCKPSCILHIKVNELKVEFRETMQTEIPRRGKKRTKHVNRT